MLSLTPQEFVERSNLKHECYYRDMASYAVFGKQNSVRKRYSNVRARRTPPTVFCARSFVFAVCYCVVKFTVINILDPCCFYPISSAKLQLRVVQFISSSCL